MPLQWSHALTRVETRTFLRVLDSESGASMEPRTHARGNVPLLEECDAPEYCFNGATHSRAWKPRDRALPESTRFRASMEPRTHARGNKGFQTYSNSSFRRFNGATHSRAWKQI